MQALFDFQSFLWCLSLCLTEYKERGEVPAYEKTATLSKKRYASVDIPFMMNNTSPAIEQEVLKTLSYKPALAGTQVLALQIHVLFKTKLT